MLAKRFTPFSVHALISAAAFSVLIGIPGTAPANDGRNHSAASASGSYLAGRHAEGIGEDLAALTFYGKATTRGQLATADLYRRIYFLGLTEGRIGDALKALDKVEKLGGQAPFANLVRAVHALKISNYTRVETLLKDETKGMTRLLVPGLTSWAKIGLNDQAGALKILDETQKESQPILYDYNVALIHDLGGDSQLAELHFLNILKSTGMSTRIVQLLGGHYERIGDIEKARTLYAKFAQDGEGSGQVLLAGLERRAKTKKRPSLEVASAQGGAAETLFNIANVLQAQAGDERVFVLAHLALYLRPDLDPAKAVVAAALETGGRYAEANAIYKGIPQTSPLSWNARTHMADNLDRMGKTDDAVKMLRSLARERPDRATAMIELGDVLRRHERFKEAAAAYTEALKRIGKIEARHWTVYYARGITYEQTNQWPKAEQDFLKALSFNAEQPLVLNYLGYSWIDQGLHLDRALKMIEKAVDLRPRDGYIVDSLGWGLYRLGKFDQAVKKMERAVMLRPEDPVINDHLGDALWQVGRKREARFQWERAKTLEPDEKLLKALDIKLKNGLNAAASN